MVNYPSDAPSEEKVIDVLKDIRSNTGGGGGGGATTDDVVTELEELNSKVGVPVAAGTITIGAAISATSNWATWPGGRGVITVGGTFGGTTVTMQCRMNSGADTVPMGSDAVFTSAGGCGFELPVGAQIRASLSGGSGISLNVLASVTGV